MGKRFLPVRRDRRRVAAWSGVLLAAAGVALPAGVTRAGSLPPITDWTNPDGGLWFDSTNWSQDVPSFGRTAMFPSFDGQVPSGSQISISLGGGVGSAERLEFQNSNDGNGYLISDGMLLLRSVGVNNSFGGNIGLNQIDVRISSQFDGQLVDLGPGFFGQGRLEFSQPIGQYIDEFGNTEGTDDFPVQGNGRFTAANTYIGTTHVASEMVLAGAAGALNSTDNYQSGFFGFSAAAVNVRNSRLILDNEIDSNSNRLRDDMRLGLKSAVLEVIGHSFDAVTENLGGLLMESGETELVLTGRGGDMNISVAAIARSAVYKPTLVLRAQDLAVAKLEVMDPLIQSELRGLGGLETEAAPVIPWMVATTADFSGNPDEIVPVTMDGEADFGTYILRPLALGEASVDAFPPPASGGGDSANVVFTSGSASAVVSAPTTVNSLTVPGSFVLQADDTLTVETGVMVFNRSPQGLSVVQGTGTVAFNNPAYLYVDGPIRDAASGVRLDVPMQGIEGVVKSGPGTLVLGVGSPDLSGDFIVQNGDVVPQDPLAFGTGNLIIAGGSDFGREARLVIRQDIELNNRIIGRTFGDYGSFGILWYTPIVLFNGSTLRLNTDPGSDSFYSLQSGDATPTKVVLQSPTSGTVGEFGFPSSIFIFDFVNLELSGVTSNSLTVFSPTSRITGSGRTLASLESNGGVISPGTDTTPIATLTASRFSGFNGILEMDIGGVMDSDQIVLTLTSTLNDPEVFLGNMALQLNRVSTYVPQVGDVITLVDIAGVTVVNGIFAGLDEGQTFSFDGYDAYLTYIGGTDGNDIQLIIGVGNPGLVKGDFGGAESTDGSLNSPDGAFNEFDVEGFLLALNDQTFYLDLNPTLAASLTDRGDFGGAESTDGSLNSPDGAFNEFDVEGFLLALNDPAYYDSIQPSGRVSAIPEPGAAAVLLCAAGLLGRRRR